MFNLDVAKVDLLLHMLQWLYKYVAGFKCFNCFQMYVASVLSGYCICCSGYTCMLQVYGLNVSPIFISIYVVSVLSGCCIFCNVAYVSDIYCKCLFKMFYLFQIYVASVFI